MDIQYPLTVADAETPPPRSALWLASLPANERQGPALPLWTEISGGPALP